MDTVIASFKLFLFALICLIVVPVQLVILIFTKGNMAYCMPYFWQKTVCKIFNVKIIVSGEPYKDSQTIYFSNHISYLDIPVIGSILKASFVAKRDVASWPVFGFLSKLQQTAFISRDRKDIAKEKYALDTMLESGKSLIIFPEGTSTDGQSVLPFKSSLFSIAMRDGLENISVQPITLKMKLINNKPAKTQDDRDLYSWHINMDTPLGEHLWRFAKNKGAHISLEFHPVLKANDFSDRKTLAKACYNAVSNGLKS